MKQTIPIIFTLGLLALFFSSWLLLPFGLLQGPLIRGEIILFALFVFSAWKLRTITVPGLCLLLLIAFPLWFMVTADGRTLFSDDNATFLYRLMLLREHFPSIPFYNPLWNSGIDARDFFATGALNVFFLLSPILYAAQSIHEQYNLIISVLLFVVVPGSTALAAKMIGLKRSGIAIAAVLAVSSSLFWYRWSLQFGTLGFITSSALLPLVIACAARFFEEEKVSLPLVGLSIITGSLVLFWTPAGIVLVPTILIGLIFIRRLLRQKWWLPTVLFMIALHIPWICLFWSVSNVDSFLSSERSSYSETFADEEKKEVEEKKVFKSKAKDLSLEEIGKHLREAAHSANPVLWILLLPGLFLLPRFPAILLSGTAVWLLCLGSIGPMIKPQLELDRMLVILLLLSAIPAAAAAQALLEEEDIPSRLAVSLILGFVFAGALSGGAVIRQRTVVPIAFESPEVSKIASAAKKYAGNGRVLFSGFVLHDFSGGHLAPLPLFADNTPIIASSPVHNLWEYKQVFPKEFISRGDEGIREYLDHMNVSTVFAHERKWREYFRERTEEFREVERIGRFSVFERLSPPDSYFHEGQGEITSQSTNEVRFTLGGENAILRFQWFPFLTIPHCTVKPFEVSKSITFIAISDCAPQDEYQLRSVGPIKRLLS